MADDQPNLHIPKAHPTDALATKLVDKSGNLQSKVKAKAPGHDKDEKSKGPAGGFDKTPVPKIEPGYTVKFTFHRAFDLPMADINTLSSDPFILAQLYTAMPSRHKEDPPLRFRTPTISRNTKPEWNSEWIVANVPRSGFKLKARLYDEDPSNYDDRLGNVSVHVDGIGDEWSGIHEQSYTIKKRMGSKRAYLVRGCYSMFNKHIKMSGEVVVSAKILGRSDANDAGRIYTVGPCKWIQHFSPLIGRLVGTKEPDTDDGGKQKTSKYK